MADLEQSELLAIECKDLAGSVSTADVVREMTEHFRPAGSTSVTKHSERVAWLEQRVAQALTLLTINQDAESWAVRGLVVTGQVAVAPYIDDVPFDILPLDQVRSLIAGAAPLTSA